MRNLNQVFINGRLGKDPQLKQTSNGASVVDFNICNNRDYKNKNGEEVKRPNWISCRAYKGLAETISRYLKKGSKVGVVGELLVDTWEDKDTNETHQRTYVLVTELEFLDGKASSGDSTNTQSTSDSTSDDYEPYSSIDDEDIF